MNKVINGDCLEELKKLEDNSVDLLCTDPPYGYSFMGKDWDKAVPSVEIWKEALRVLKPGAFAFIMSAPRSDVLSRMIVRIEDAGFRVDFSPIYWTYASGFPKAMNIGKMVDKRLGVERIKLGEREVPDQRGGQINSTATVQNGGIKTRTVNIEIATSDQAKALDGSYGGFQPKPAVEVIIVAMKPLSEKTFVDQALKNKGGITWLDDCRVPSGGHVVRGGSNFPKGMGGGSTWSAINEERTGRFPANLLVSDDVLNDGRVTTSAGGKNIIKNRDVYGEYSEKRGREHFGDSGSYSRYFDLDAWAKTLPFLIVPKASKREKNEGLEGFEIKKANYLDYRPNAESTKGGDTPYAGTNRNGTNKNNHPTVKPLKLMSYLITLGSREGDVVLDPFLGSGTTACAAKALGRQYIGIEKDREYAEIARARIFHKHTPEQQRLFDKISIPAE